jgi:hypothetical protein
MTMYKAEFVHVNVDNATRRRHVEEARALIFQLGVPVDGARVKAILDDESYVPIRVSSLMYSLCKCLTTGFRTLFRSDSRDMDSICSSYGWSTSFTSLR